MVTADTLSTVMESQLELESVKNRNNSTPSPTSTVLDRSGLIFISYIFSVGFFSLKNRSWGSSWLAAGNFKPSRCVDKYTVRSHSALFSLTWHCRQWKGKPMREVAILWLGMATKSIFVCFLLVKNQWLLVGEILFSSVPPSNSFVAASNPWRAFWADKAPFTGPQPQLVCCFRN